MKLNSYEKWKSQAASLAKKYEELEKFGEAKSLLWKALLLTPEDLEVRIQFAKILLRNQEFEQYRREVLFLSFFLPQGEKARELLEALKQGLEFFPQDVNFLTRTAQLAEALAEEETMEKLYNSLAEIYQEKALPSRAIEMYEKIITLLPEKFEYHGKIADVLLQEELRDQAVVHYLKISSHYLERERFTEASVSLKRVLEIQPDNREAVFLLSRAYLAQGKVQEAKGLVHQPFHDFVEKGKVEEAAALSRWFSDLLSQSGYQEEASQEKEASASLLLSQGKSDEAYLLLLEAADEELSRENLKKSTDLYQKALEFYFSRNNIGKISEIYQKLIPAAAVQDEGKAKNFLEELIKQFFRLERIRELDSLLHGIANQLEKRGNASFAREVLFRLAEVYVSIYKLPKAIQIYKSLAEKNPDDPQVYIRLADLYGEKEISKALDSYGKAAELFIKSGREEQAEEVLRPALTKAPHDPSLAARFASSFYEQKLWKKAIQYYQVSLARDSSYRSAVLGIAMAYGKTGMLDEIVSLAKQFVTQGIVSEIVEEYRKAVSGTVPPAEAALALGSLCKDLGFLEEAMTEFRKAAEDSHYFLAACNQLCLCFKRQGFPELAIRQYRKALERTEYSEEQLLEIRYNLALTYEEVGMSRDAVNLYSDILAIDIDYRDAKTRIGKLRRKPGDGKVIAITREGEKSGS